MQDKVNKMFSMARLALYTHYYHKNITVDRFVMTDRLIGTLGKLMLSPPDDGHITLVNYVASQRALPSPQSDEDPA